jgi:hypothetical protein
MAFTGVASLHAATTSINSIAIVTGIFSPITAGTVHFRAHYFIPEGTTVGLFKLAALDGPTDADGRDELNVDINVTGDRSVQVYSQVSRNSYLSTPNAIPEGEWFCLHGSISLSDTAGIVTVGVNGTTVVTTDPEDTLPPSGLGRADFGIGWTQQQQITTNVYVDNIVVDTSPIPCL